MNASEDGSVTYTIRQDVAHLLCFPPIEDEKTNRDLARLNRMAEERGWRQAIVELYGADSPMARYVCDPLRARFVELLPLTKEMTVLEIGSGLGQITTTLAARAGHVEAIEVVSGQAVFTHRRCLQEGLTNVRVVCGGDDCRLPYSAGRFDIVIMNLVLEWCFHRDPLDTPAACQARLLREASRVLKSGGLLYLSTKNRYSIRLLLGGRDEHAGEMRFGSAFPRWLMALLIRLRRKKGFFGLIHSFGDLGRLVRRCGFGDFRTYWAAPEMRYPRWLIPTLPREIDRARRMPGFITCERRMCRWIMDRIPSRWLQYVTPGLVILARFTCTEEFQLPGSLLGPLSEA